MKKWFKKSLNWNLTLCYATIAGKSAIANNLENIRGFR